MCVRYRGERFGGSRARTARGPVARLDELLGRPVSLRALALLRVLVGPIVLLHLAPFLSDSLHGETYRDAFYEPYAGWYPELPEAGYIALLWVGPRRPRGDVARLPDAAGNGDHVRGGRLQPLPVDHALPQQPRLPRDRPRAARVAPAARAVVDAWLRARGLRLDRRAGWPLWLLRFECSVVYGASGLSKLLDPDWFGGTVTWQRVVQARDQLDPLPHWAQSVLTDRGFHTGAAKLIVLTELFIALGLWSRRTRYAAVWVAVVFHSMIERSARWRSSRCSASRCSLIWAVPSTRDRVLRIDSAARGSAGCPRPCGGSTGSTASGSSRRRRARRSRWSTAMAPRSAGSPPACSC